MKIRRIHVDLTQLANPLLHYILFLQRLVRPFLYLEGDGPRLKYLHPMPYAFGNVDAVVVTSSREDGVFNHVSVIIIQNHTHPAPYQDEGLRTITMPMDRNNRTGLHCIEEAMSRIRQLLMKVVVHPQARGLLCLLRHGIQ